MVEVKSAALRKAVLLTKERLADYMHTVYPEPEMNDKVSTIRDILLDAAEVLEDVAFRAETPRAKQEDMIKCAKTMRLLAETMK